MSQGLFQPIYPNPYIVGNPIRSREMFFGRLDEFHFIARALDDGRKAALIVLFGERRSGKSSILYQIQNGQLGEAFLPIFVDMQIMAGIASEAEFFSRLITDTGKALGKEAPKITSNILRPDDSNAAEGFRQFLWALKEHFPGRAPLLLIDEYEILENKITEGCLSRNVLTFFGGLLESEQVSFVFTGSKRLESHNAELWGSELLQKATSRKISFLTRDDTTRLVTQPLENKVTFAPEVLEQIYALTAGQPFYTQLICQNLVYHLNEVKKHVVEKADLEKVVEGILENPPPQLIFNWGEHSPEHKLTLALLAEFSQKPGRYLSTASIRHRIKQSKLDIVLNEAKLKTWLTDLCKDEYLLQQDYRFSFRLDLFRRWIRHDHNIWQVKKEIGQEELDRICERERIKKEQKKKIIIVLERVALAVAVMGVVYLGIWLYNVLVQQQVEVSGNGGPFEVIAVANGDTVRFHAGKKEAGNRYSGKIKLKKAKTYVFAATLRANNETPPTKTLKISDEENKMDFEFRKHPVTVITDARKMLATLGDTTARLTPKPWKHIFYVCAGNYEIVVRDSSTSEEKKDSVNVINDSVDKYIDFDQVVAIALQANLPFKCRYSWVSLKNKKRESEVNSADSTLVTLRGCPKGTYQFTFTNPRTGQTISMNKSITIDDSINVNFGDTVVITLRANVPFVYKALHEKSNKIFESQASASTFVLKGCPKGLYQFTFTNPRTGQTISRKQSIQTNEIININFLPRLTHRLQINTEPSGAEVILNGKPSLQKTSFVDDLPKGSHSIKLIKAGYDTLDFLISLNNDTTITKDLVQQTGHLMVTVNARDGGAALRDAKIYVEKAGENQEQYLGEAGKLANQSAKLQVGRYILRVVRDGFNDDRREIYISKGKTEKHNVELTKQ